MVKTHRGFEDVTLKIGFDGGDGFFKICLSILENSEELQPDVNQNRLSYKDGIAANKFKDSGVKETFILAITEDIQENFGNVSFLWKQLNLNSLTKFTISTD